MDRPTLFTTGSALTLLDGLAKSQKVFDLTQGFKYRILYNSSTSCVISVIDKTVRGKNNWIFRLDKPHKRVKFDHININYKFSGVRDPHIKLPPGSLGIAEKASKVGSILNKIAVYTVIAIDTGRISKALYSDYYNGTIKNTVETSSEICAGWCGGYAGAKTGAIIGSSIFPGVGTMIGGMAGAVSGGIGGIWYTRKSLEQISSTDPNYTQLQDALWALAQKVPNFAPSYYFYQGKAFIGSKF